MDYEHVKQLLHAGDNEKNTPLHLAARTNNKDIFQCLLDAGRKLENSNANGKEKDYLYRVTAPRNQTGRTPLHECALYNRTSFIEELLSPKKDDARERKKQLDTSKDDNQMTCLHLACSKGKHTTYSKKTNHSFRKKISINVQ